MSAGGHWLLFWTTNHWGYICVVVIAETERAWCGMAVHQQRSYDNSAVHFLDTAISISPRLADVNSRIRQLSNYLLAREQAANMLSQAVPGYNHHYADLLSVNYRPADFQDEPKNVKVGDTWYQNTVWAWECIGESPESSARIVLLAAGGY